MTRINVAIAPHELPSKLLLAELREIKRVPNQVKKQNVDLSCIPDTFRLGSGHVKFFYNKLGYLKERYLWLREEALKRGYNVSDFTSAWEGLPENLMGMYLPSRKDRLLLEERIKEKGHKLIQI